CLDDAEVRKSPGRDDSQRERDVGRGGRGGGLVRQIRARRQKSEERDRGGTEHGGTLRETDGNGRVLAGNPTRKGDCSGFFARSGAGRYFPPLVKKGCSVSSVRLPPEPSALHRQHASGAMRGRKQKARGKREMIDERSELGLVCRPMRRPVEPEGEKHDIGCGQQRRFRKI